MCKILKEGKVTLFICNEHDYVLCEDCLDDHCFCFENNYAPVVTFSELADKMPQEYCEHYSC